MELKIYVITTNISLKCERDALELLKIKLCEKYGGLTVMPNCEGYWQNNGKLIRDDVQIWEILSSTVISTKEAIQYATVIKQICKQISQLITINGQPYFV